MTTLLKYLFFGFTAIIVLLVGLLIKDVAAIIGGSVVIIGLLLGAFIPDDGITYRQK